MDLSIFEQAFALRAEARKAQLGANGPDLSKLSQGSDGGKIMSPPRLPQEELAAGLLARALALHEQANKFTGKSDQASRAAIAELLRAMPANQPGPTRPLS